MPRREQTVLIADANAEIIEALAAALEDEGELLFATSGNDAMELAFREIPDLIILDTQLLDPNGYEVCARMKADSRTQGIPILLMNPPDREADEERGLRLGAVDFLPKPLRLPIVRSRVHCQLELRKLRILLETLSIIDELTDLYNLRHFKFLLDIEIRRARRQNGLLALILIDIDYFKQFNDLYGHISGDRCLQEVANLLGKVFKRATDFKVRYGGDELIIIAINTEAKDIARLAEELRLSIMARGLVHGGSPISETVTVSIGTIAARIDNDKNPEWLLQRVDEALHEAKREGRNRVVNYQA